MKMCAINDGLGTKFWQRLFIVLQIPIENQEDTMTTWICDHELSHLECTKWSKSRGGNFYTTRYTTRNPHGKNTTRTRTINNWVIFGSTLYDPFIKRVGFMSTRQPVKTYV